MVKRKRTVLLIAHPDRVENLTKTLLPGAKVISVSTKRELGVILGAQGHENISAVVATPFTNGDPFGSPDTLGIIEMMRDAGFTEPRPRDGLKRPMISMCATSMYQDMLSGAGCTHNITGSDMGSALLEIIG